MSAMLPAAALRFIDLKDKIAKYDISPEENGSHKITIDFGGDGDDVQLIPTIPLLARLRRIFEQSKHIVLLNETWDADVHSIIFRVNMGGNQQQQHDSSPGLPQSPPSVAFGERSLGSVISSDSVISSSGARDQASHDAGENIAVPSSSSSQKPAARSGAVKKRGRPPKEDVCSSSSSSSTARKCNKRPASVGELSETAATAEADDETTKRMCAGQSGKCVAESSSCATSPARVLEAADFEKILREVHERRQKTGRPVTVRSVMKMYNVDRHQARAVLMGRQYVNISAAAKKLAKRFRNELAQPPEQEACEKKSFSSSPCRRSYKKKQQSAVSDSDTEVNHGVDEEAASQSSEAALVNKANKNIIARRRERRPKESTQANKKTPRMLSRRQSRAQTISPTLAGHAESVVVVHDDETRFNYQNVSVGNIVHGTRARKPAPKFYSRSRSPSLRILQSVHDLADSESESDSLPHSTQTAPPHKSTDATKVACNKQTIVNKNVAEPNVAAAQSILQILPLHEAFETPKGCAATFSRPKKPTNVQNSSATSSPARNSCAQQSGEKARVRALVVEADLCRKLNRSLSEQARQAQAKIMAGKFSVSEKSAMKILNVVTCTHADKSVEECVEMLLKKLRPIHNNGGDSSDDNAGSDRQSVSVLVPGSKRGGDAVSSANTSVRSMESFASATSTNSTYSRFVPPVEVTSSANAVSSNIGDAASRKTAAANYSAVRSARFVKVEDTSDNSIPDPAVADVKPTASLPSASPPKTMTAVPPVPRPRAPEPPIRHDDNDDDDDIQILTPSHNERMLILKNLLDKKSYPPAPAKDIASKLMMSVSELGQFITRFLPGSRPYVHFDVSV